MSLNKKQLQRDTRNTKRYQTNNRWIEDIPVSLNGQFDYPGSIVKVPSNNITMKGVPYPILGKDQYGNQQLMLPGQDYVFPGDVVTEYPILQTGGVPDDYEEFLKFNSTAPENRQLKNDDYDYYGMWKALGKPANWEEALQLTNSNGEPILKQDPYDNSYHGFSVGQNGEYLKLGYIPGQGVKPGSTAWMELMSQQLSPDDWGAKYNTTVWNPELQRLQEIPKNTTYKDGGPMLAPLELLHPTEDLRKKKRGVIEALKEAIFNKERIEPIDVKNKDGKLDIEDGHHRYRAYKELGIPMVPVKFQKGGSQNPITKNLPFGSVFFKNYEPDNGEDPLNVKSFVKEQFNYETPQQVPITVGEYKKQAGTNAKYLNFGNLTDTDTIYVRNDLFKQKTLSEKDKQTLNRQREILANDRYFNEDGSRNKNIISGYNWTPAGRQELAGVQAANQIDWENKSLWEKTKAVAPDIALAALFDLGLGAKMLKGINHNIAKPLAVNNLPYSETLNKIFPQNDLEGLLWMRNRYNHPDMRQRLLRIYDGNEDGVNTILNWQKRMLDNYKPKNYANLFFDAALKKVKDLSVKNAIQIHKHSAGTSFGIPEGVYIKGNLGAKKEGTRVHELSHLLDKNGHLITILDDEARLLEPLIKRYQLSPTISERDYKTYKYLTDPSEVRARMNETLFQFNLKPGDIFTEELFNQAYNKNKINGLGYVISDKNQFIHLMNSYWKMGGELPAQSFITELEDDEIEWYRKNGYSVEILE